ncbi:hypothetical protein BDV3_001215 [Batrachochytrium dendrobatidis]|nr:hypothetical protein O5D80_000673 [Batrachochytrium dendrobatidis]KAK5672231.1 hypothetical protein QVD99_002031 [Batrachochytrium dendrobatidis]
MEDQPENTTTEQLYTEDDASIPSKNTNHATLLETADMKDHAAITQTTAEIPATTINTTITAISTSLEKHATIEESLEEHVKIDEPLKQLDITTTSVASTASATTTSAHHPYGITETSPKDEAPNSPGSIIEPASATTDIAQIVSPSSIPVTVHQLPSAGHGLKPPQNLQKIITDNNVALPKDFATTASVDLSAEGTQSNSASDAMDGPDRDVVYVAFGPRGGWYVRWSDGSSAWEQIPPSLHTKLYGRMRNLPHAECISISEMSQWVTVFGDGSFATSGFPVYGKLKEALHDPPQDAELKTLIFAPGGGWLLMRDDGSMAWERLPSGLDELLKRRTKADAPVDCVSISGFGGWFLRFTDGECEWDAIPKPLEKLLIQLVRRGDPSIVVTLSPSDGMSYFVAVGDTAEWVHDSASLRMALEWANGADNVVLPETVVVNIYPPTPPQSESSSAI